MQCRTIGKLESERQRDEKTQNEFIRIYILRICTMNGSVVTSYSRTHNLLLETHSVCRRSIDDTKIVNGKYLDNNFRWGNISTQRSDNNTLQFRLANVRSVCSGTFVRTVWLTARAKSPLLEWMSSDIAIYPIHIYDIIYANTYVSAISRWPNREQSQSWTCFSVIAVPPNSLSLSPHLRFIPAHNIRNCSCWSLHSLCMHKYASGLRNLFSVECVNV